MDEEESENVKAERSGVIKKDKNKVSEQTDGQKRRCTDGKTYRRCTDRQTEEAVYRQTDIKEVYRQTDT